MFMQQRKSIQHIMTSALLLVAVMVTPQTSAAGDCEVTIDATDSMAFSTKEIAVKKSCKEFNITLKHIGKMGKNIMAHNLVITKEADQKAVLEDGSKAGAAGEYVKVNDARIVAHTKLIGG